MVDTKFTSWSSRTSNRYKLVVITGDFYLRVLKECFIRAVINWQRIKCQMGFLTNQLLISGQDDQRLNLLYLANDICQRERSKGRQPLKEAFVPRLAEAISLMRHDETLKNK